MSPAIRHGEMMIVEPATIEVLRPGDVALCLLAGGRLLAHRVVWLLRAAPEAPRLVVRGDNRASCDQPLDAGAVLGRVAFVERWWRRVRLST